MSQHAAIEELLGDLNAQQREAATSDRRPLLIVAGAGTGKTATLVHRVAWLVAGGVDPARILLLTFTRRAAAEMIRRTDGLLHRMGLQGASRIWGGTYHATASRLLHRYGKSIGLPADFSVHDRTDSEDLLNVIRTDLELAKGDKRFPKKGTCMAIYSRCVNAQEKLDDALPGHFPWCHEWHDELKRLFDAYVDRKEAAGVLDYDDLLLFWNAMLADPKTGDAIRKLFDCILVDEYQDTNTLQAEIMYRLSPHGEGLTVVGDDAQSIYAFRAATVRNILDFPKHYPNAVVVALEQNYRSTQAILDATNHVISLAKERYTKNLWSTRTDSGRPKLIHCEDEHDQCRYVIRRILEHREAGIALHKQAVLFRASYHSMMLEAELAQAGIPFHKFGGLKFVETAHVKDLMAFLRLAENPRDIVAGTRLLLLMPGIGPGKARRLIDILRESGQGFDAWADWKPPAESASLWSEFVSLIAGLVPTKDELSVQINRVRKFYAPILESNYDNPAPRLRDLEQLEIIASRYTNRARMLLELTLDPPSSTQDLAGPPKMDDDYLILSTIHSAKGLEWDAVYVIHASDGSIPSDMATRNDEEIEEERRLFYVALTRAKTWLYVCFPLRYYWPGRGDHHSLPQRTRFLPNSVVQFFEQCVTDAPPEDDAGEQVASQLTSQSVRRSMKELWG